jgi:hypothetical protein
VLPLDHLQRDLQISEKRHNLIVKQWMPMESRAFPPGQRDACAYDSSNDYTASHYQPFLLPMAQTGSLQKSLP